MPPAIHEEIPFPKLEDSSSPIAMNNSAATIGTFQVVKLKVLHFLYACREIIFAIAIFTLLVAIPVFFARMPEIRRLEYGPLIFLCCWYIPLTLFFRERGHCVIAYFLSHKDESEIASLRRFFRFSPWAFFLIILIPYVISDTVKEVLNPKGYWTAKANKANDCAFSNQMLQDLREEVIVAANKLNMGIGTSQELRDAKAALDLMRGVFEGCETQYEQKIGEAKRKLAELNRSGPP